MSAKEDGAVARESTQRFSALQQQLLCAGIRFFHRHIRSDKEVLQRMEGNEMFRLFNEVQYHSNKPDLNRIFPESVHDCSALHVCSFILSILHQGIFSVSAFVVSVIYLSRFKESSHITLHAFTWRPLFLTSLLLADKVWEDKPVRNSSLAKLFPVLSNAELNNMESGFLGEISFNVLVKPDLFCSFCEKLLAEQVQSEIVRCVSGSEYAATLQADQEAAPAKPSFKAPADVPKDTDIILCGQLSGDEGERAKSGERIKSVAEAPATWPREPVEAPRCVGGSGVTKSASTPQSRVFTSLNRAESSRKPGKTEEIGEKPASRSALHLRSGPPNLRRSLPAKTANGFSPLTRAPSSRGFSGLSSRSTTGAIGHGNVSGNLGNLNTAHGTLGSAATADPSARRPQSSPRTPTGSSPSESEKLSEKLPDGSRLTTQVSSDRSCSQRRAERYPTATPPVPRSNVGPLKSQRRGSPVVAGIGRHPTPPVRNSPPPSRSHGQGTGQGHAQGQAQGLGQGHSQSAGQAQGQSQGQSHAGPLPTGMGSSMCGTASSCSFVRGPSSSVPMSTVRVGASRGAGTSMSPTGGSSGARPDLFRTSRGRSPPPHILKSSSSPRQPRAVTPGALVKGIAQNTSPSARGAFNCTVNSHRGG